MESGSSGEMAASGVPRTRPRCGNVVLYAIGDVSMRYKPPGDHHGCVSAPNTTSIHVGLSPIDQQDSITASKEISQAKVSVTFGRAKVSGIELLTASMSRSG